MTDDLHPLDEPSDAELAALTALLARAEPWDELPRWLEDSVVAAIAAEAPTTTTTTTATTTTPTPTPTPTTTTTPTPTPTTAATDSASVATSPARRRARSRWSAPRMLGAAAAVVVIVAGIAVLTRGSSDGVTFALEGTEAQPGASAKVTVWSTPAGLKILLDLDGLPGAPQGYMYEAWVGDGRIGVSAGTFHLRGGNGAIVLWAGVTGTDFDRIWITLEPIDDDAASSSDARLRGEFTLADD